MSRTFVRYQFEDCDLWQPTNDETLTLRDANVAMSSLEPVRFPSGIVWAERGGGRLVIVGRDQRCVAMALSYVDKGPFIVELMSECEGEADGCGMPWRSPTRMRSVVAVVCVGSECVAKLLKKDEVRVETKIEKTSTVVELKNRAKSALMDEAPTAAWMTAARAAIDRSAPQIGKVLVRAKVIKAPTAEMITAFAKTELGSGLYGFAAGTILSAHPRAAKKPWLGMIAKHMRLEGMARIGGVLVDPLLSAMESVLLGAVEGSGIDVAEVGE